MIYNTITKRVV